MQLRVQMHSPRIYQMYALTSLLILYFSSLRLTQLGKSVSFILDRLSLAAAYDIFCSLFIHSTV